MQTIYFASIFILRPTADGHEVLLGLRSPEKKYMGGTWQLISGQIEGGEAAWQAAVREVREETGLELLELYRLPSVTTFYRPDNDSLNTAIEFCGFVSADATPTLNPENTEFHWVPIDEAADRLMWPADRNSLRELRSEILGDRLAKAYLKIAL